MNNQQLLVALAQVLGQMPKSAKFSKATKRQVNQRVDVQAKIDAAVRRLGFKTPGVAHENVLTYDKWLEKGRRVRKGQKALPGLKFLFHIEQTDVVA